MSEYFSVREYKGKYYGTDILWGKDVIGAIWHHSDDSVPSTRELENMYKGATLEDWRNDPKDWFSDSHWESQDNLDEAIALVKTLNAMHQHP